MTTLKFITFLLLAGLCSCSQQPAKHKTNPDAVKFSNRIIPLINHLDNVDSCKKAISFLDSATAIDSNCFLCYYNKLMFVSSLKRYDKALMAINNCIRIKLYAHDLYLTGGFLYEKLSDTFSSNAYFQKSLTLCNIALDTMNASSRDYSMFVTNKSVNLIMLGDSVKANKTLKELYSIQSDDPVFDNVEKKFILSLINKTKSQLIANFSDPEKYSR